jgi:hypothetical protein
VPSGSEALLPPNRLEQLAPVFATLIDAADAFDSDTLVIDVDCEVHGPRAVSNAECSCSGERFSAVEFVQALGLDIRNVIEPVRREPLSEDRRARWERKHRAQRVEAVAV